MFEARRSDFAGQSAGWCILRTKPSLTLKLATTLSEDGFEAWSPAETKIIRVPRMHARRSVEQAIMPSYVFARVDRMLDLLEMEREAVKPRRGTGWGKPAHASFHVMRFAGRMAVISDHDLAQLRRIEERAELARVRSQKARPFAQGVKVRVKSGVASGAFGGMVAHVTSSSSGSTRIRFDGSSLEVSIRTSLLDENDVGPSQSLPGIAARDAG